MGFAPDDLGFIADPCPAYAELREGTPVVLDESTDHWLVYIIRGPEALRVRV